ncbi:hypothetical protein CGE01nite_23480 [Cellulomonas gelida]|uniref:Uncharacterized protein n=1 Tax=Cellulomonas gelida TaxID=1712 RepID=A0A4Y3KM89_9CELL|nr:hypothetical protein CGE01nite_23480 [Cellulomonas gelida]
MTVPGAWTQTMPRISLPSMTVPGSVTFTSPSTTVRRVPVGTPVLPGPGRPVDGALGDGLGVLGGRVGDVVGCGAGLVLGAGDGVAEAVGLGDAVAPGLGVVDGLGAGVVMPGRFREIGWSTPSHRQKRTRQTVAWLRPSSAFSNRTSVPRDPAADEPPAAPAAAPPSVAPAGATPSARGAGRAATWGAGAPTSSRTTWAEAMPPATMPTKSAPTTVATAESARCPIIAPGSLSGCFTVRLRDDGAARAPSLVREPRASTRTSEWDPAIGCPDRRRTGERLDARHAGPPGMTAQS